MADDYLTLPENLPRPVDDGAADQVDTVEPRRRLLDLAKSLHNEAAI